MGEQGAPEAATHREPGTGTRATLLERAAEIERIESTLASVPGGEGAVFAVEGAAGVGKSALLRAAAEAASDSGFEVLRATGREIEREFAFGVVTQLFAQPLAELDPDRHERVFAGAADLARPLFEGSERLRPDGDTFPRLHGLHWLCANLSSERPLLLVVDDAHWADRPSLDFLAYLAPRVRELEICMAVGIRSRETGAGAELGEALAREGARALHPAALSEPAIERLLRDRLGPDGAERLARQCARATGGNPLFLRELIRSLEGRNGAGIDPDQVAVHAPPSVSRIVLDRLSGMEEQDGRVLRAIAVLGDGADSRLIAQVSGVGADLIAPSIDRLIEVGLLDEQELLSFEHPIVRRAVYESIPPAARSRDHLWAARAMAADPRLRGRAAAHLLEADAAIEPAGPAEIEALLSAARGARERGATETGARFLRRALEEDLNPARRRGALLELGTAELRLGDGRSLEHLEQAERLSSDGPERAEAALAHCTARAQSGSQAAAVEICDAALAVVGDVRELRLALEAQRAHAAWVGGTMGDHERQRLRALEPEVKAGASPAERAVLTVLAAEAGTTATREAAKVSQLAELALADGRLLAEGGAEHPTYLGAVAAITLATDYPAAIAGWSAGVEDSRRRGSISGYATALFSRGFTKYHAGDVAGAEADSGEALGLLVGRDLITAPLPLATAAYVAIERGRLDPEVERALEAEVGGEEAPTVGTVVYAIVASGWLALSRGEFELARVRFRGAGGRAAEIGWTGPSQLAWRSGLAHALRRLERDEEALAAVEEELALARAYRAPGPLGIALRAKALVVGGGDGIELAGEAVATLAASGARLEHAKALIDLGAALRRSGARKDSQAPLREGMDLAHRCGSTSSVERALQELRASGARPRRPAQHGVAALSPQERQTSRLAAEGQSNREIAESMFLTRRTVEMHLTGAYRKLGIDSREDLPAALRPETDAPL